MGKPTGRPRKLDDPAFVEALLVDIRDTAGVPSVVAGAHGVSRQLWSVWEQKASEGVEPYAGFFAEVARACDAAEVSLLRKLAALPVTAKGSADAAQARAYQWVLERLRADRYGQRIDVRVREEALSHVLQRLRERLDPATLARVLGALVDENGEPDADRGSPRH